ncbi:MAG: phosphoribosylanthranilate isomerase [Dehalococcoidia bacterium]
MRVKVKICGITSLEDALAAVEFGADALGFIFAPSPRQVTPETVKRIISELPPFVTRVGVFMGHPLGEVKAIMDTCGLDLAQLHHDEDEAFCAELFPRIIKTFTPETLPSLEEVRRYRVAAFIIDKQKGSDTPPEKLWPIASRMKEYGRVILAGSLTPDNVAAAVRAVQPYAVDVASGVEREPGKKDHRKMQDFIYAAKSS